MADVTNIELYGQRYNIKDANARSSINNLNNELSNYKTSNDNKVNNLIKRSALYGTIVLIGDSYLAGWTPDGNVVSWGERLRTKLNKNLNEWKTYSQGGCGFVTTNNGINFATLTQTAVNDSSFDNNSVTMVLYGGGYNDCALSISATQHQTGIRNALSIASANFPNAIFVYAYMPWSQGTGDNTKNPYNKIATPWRINNAIAGMTDYKMVFLDNIYKSLQMKDTALASDGYHPNGNGQLYIATAIYEALLGQYIPAPRESYQSADGKSIFMTADENNIYINLYNGLSLNVSVDSILCSGSIKVASYDLYNTCGFPIRPGAEYWTGNIQGYIHGSEGFFACTYNLHLTDDGKLDIYPMAISDSHNNYQRLTNVDGITLNNGILTIPRIMS